MPNVRLFSRVLTVSILLVLSCSFAQGQFLQLSRYDNGLSLGAFVQADINLDGKTDIVAIRAVSGSTSSEMTVLLGNGSGGFTAAPGSPFRAGASPQSVTVTDENGDGYPDIVTADSSQ